MLEEINGSVSRSIIAEAASNWGEQDANIKEAIGVMLPTILGGLIQKTEDKLLFGNIYDLLLEEHDLDVLQNTQGLFDREAFILDDQREAAEKLIKLLFSNKIGGILDLVSNFAGIKKTSTTALLGLLVPVVVGYMAQKIKKENLSEVELATFLTGQYSNILSSMPADTSSLLGFTDKSKSSDMTKPNQMNKWLPWALVLLGILALIYFWKGSQKQETSTSNPPVAATSQPGSNHNAEAAGNSPQNIGDAPAQPGTLAKKKLACGTELNIPENGVEAQIIAFIDDKGQPVEKEIWFTMDRLVFQTGHSSLDVSKSSEQLRNIADILKCYPNVVLKIGASVNNLGKKEDNLKLSTLRANTVKATIIALGAKPSSMEAEGLGDQYPKASNGSETGRALDGQVVVQVKAK